MKNINSFILLALLLLICFDVSGQSRKHVSQFSQFQSYFNPGLTGYEGSIVRSFVRSQSSGFEGAPKTFFISTELDFGELSGEIDPALMGKNAISINLLHDTYGAFRENEVLIGYASRIRLSKNHNLRLGAAVSYQSIRLDGNMFTSEESSDPTLSQYLGSFSDMQVIDFNMGMALTHRNYYVSYGVQRINGGSVSRGDQFMDGYPAEQIVQAGYREAISPSLAVIVNGFFRSRKDLANLAELNFKVLAMNKVWVGAGHRVDYSNNIQVGANLKQIRLGYVYEFPSGQRYLMTGTTHEITASFKLFPEVFRNKSNKTDVMMW